VCETPSPLQLWGGLECTVNRVGDTSYEQLHRTGHHQRIEDLDLFADLGITALRYPILWERTAPSGLEQADWTWPDERLGRLRELGIRPIVGLLHHGHGPRDTSLIDPLFPEKLALYARSVAERYPWVDAYTPINEPLTTARFCGLYGVWYPHANDPAVFARIQLAQCKAVVLAMQAIRQVNPSAQLVQNEDLGKVHATPLLQYEADFQNERRWLTFDLLCGKLDRAHPFWVYFRTHGVEEEELEWFLQNTCPPDVLGFDYYINSERYIDHHVERYPPKMAGSNGRHAYVDMSAAEVREEGIDGPPVILRELWDRYGLPIAITEVHHGSTREEQMRWYLETWRTTHALRDEGVNIVAFTSWALLGLYDWNSLVTCDAGWYEAGVFDVRGPKPRPTGIHEVMRCFGRGEEPDHPILEVPGWWHRPLRLVHGFSLDRKGRMKVVDHGNLSINRLVSSQVQPVLIAGTGTLGTAFARVCDVRGLPYRLLSRAEMDITQPESVQAALDLHHPWAVVNAAGYTGMDDAETDESRCYAENAHGAGVLAAACARRDIRFLTFSSDMVFSANGRRPHGERSRVSPSTVYGHSKVAAERRVLRTLASALVVRSGPLFGPWDATNPLTQGLQRLARAMPPEFPTHDVISPTYTPDLAHASLDLLIDGASGIWHLANEGATSWYDLCSRVSMMISSTTVELMAVEPAFASPYLGSRVLVSARGNVMPSLDDALARYVVECEHLPGSVETTIDVPSPAMARSAG
jgi:dTDP-4-dehydrorhamnose reductase